MVLNPVWLYSWPGRLAFGVQSHPKQIYSEVRHRWDSPPCGGGQYAKLHRQNPNVQIFMAALISSTDMEKSNAVGKNLSRAK